MELARVVGQVVATVKQQGLHGVRLLIVEQISADGDVEESTTHGGRYVAIDYAGAGLDEVVLVTRGSAARIDEQAAGVPTDAAIVAIVDSIVLDNKTTFRKNG